MLVNLDSPAVKRVAQLITDLTVQVEQKQKEIKELIRLREAAQITWETLRGSTTQGNIQQVLPTFESPNGNMPSIQENMPLILAILLVVIRSPYNAWRGRDITKSLGVMEYQADMTRLGLNVANCMSMYSKPTRQHPKVFEVKRHAQIPYYTLTNDGKVFLEELLKNYVESPEEEVSS